MSDDLMKKAIRQEAARINLLIALAEVVIDLAHTSDFVPYSTGHKLKALLAELIESGQG